MSDMWPEVKVRSKYVSLWQVVCLFKGHDWNRVHGFHNDPEHGAICHRCDKHYETRDEWRRRTGQ